MDIHNKVDVLGYVTPIMKEIIEAQLNASDSFDVNASMEVLRNNYESERKKWNDSTDLENVETVEETIPYLDKKIKIKIYNKNKSNKIIFFTHGGGWVVGSNNTHDRIMRILAIGTKATVIGIDYSLSPEAKFPRPVEECTTAIRYYLDEFKDVKNLEVYMAGDSVGAYLAVANYLALYKKGFNHSLVKGLILYYGIYGLQDSVSRKLYGGPWDGLSEADIKYYYDMYLEKDGDIENQLVNLFNSDLSVLPPAFIASCEFDPLKDDSVLLAKIMEKSIKVKYVDYPGVIHGFLHYSKVLPEAQEALNDGICFVNNL